MNYKRIMIEYGHLTMDQLPPGIRATVESTPRLLEYWNLTAQLQSNLREQCTPSIDPALGDRLAYKVRCQLEQPGRITTANTEPDMGLSFPIWRWLGVAASVAVVALGAVRLWIPAPEGSPSTLAEQPEEMIFSIDKKPIPEMLAGINADEIIGAETNQAPRIDRYHNSIDGRGGNSLLPVSNPATPKIRP